MRHRVAVVLAAGLGTRMKSKTPKALHKLAGIPMLQHVINALNEAEFQEIILVLGYQGELVEAELGTGYEVVYQHEQLGTGHALLQALPVLQKYADGDCLVVCGDTPCIRSETLKALAEKHTTTQALVSVLTAEIADPTGYGRIIKGTKGIEKIVEEKDATLEEKAIREINTGTYCFNIKSLRACLDKLTPANAQGEYYLTDIIKYNVEAGERVETLLLDDPFEALGINNRVQLAQAESIWRTRINEQHMLEGITIINPENTSIDVHVSIGKDTILLPGVILEGKTSLGENCVIGPNTRIVDSAIEDNVNISYSYILEAEIASGCTVGPFSYLRPGTVLAKNVKVGDFVEVKKSFVGEGSKIPHLTYVGDSVLGKGVNIGAGTITCNYDGVNKHPTYIGDGAFVGSNSNLVAPITIGAGAYIGAGSTVTKDIPEKALAIARGKQQNFENWHTRVQKNPAQDNDREDEDVEL